MFDTQYFLDDEEYCIKDYVYEYNNDIIYKYDEDLTVHERFEDEYIDLINWLEIRKHDMNKDCDNCLDYMFNKWSNAITNNIFFIQFNQ